MCILVSLIFLLCVQEAYAQVQGYYSHKVDNIGTIYMRIYPNNFYSLTWNLGDANHNIDSNISYGKWYVDQGKIVLKDCVHNYQIVCTYSNVYLFGHHIRNNTEITIEDSFKWLNDRKFKKYLNLGDDSTPNLGEFPFDSNFNPSLAQKEREGHYSAKSKNTLYFGEYNDGGVYRLWIQPNNSYILKFQPMDSTKEIICSEGTWERTGNMLTLFDTSVKCSFFLVISKEGLIPNQMMYSIHDFSLPFRYTLPNK